jgi:ubiquinone/menaquinone biosynthesis C-methylase UbiE
MLELVSPLAGQRFVHRLVLHGTVRLVSATSARIRCVAGSRTVASWTIGNGAGQARDRGQGASAQAIDAVLPERDLPTRRWIWLRWLADVEGQRRPVLLDSFPVRRARHVGPRTPRHEYGRVWDREVRNARDARIAVAGYADENEWRRSGESTAHHVQERLDLRPDSVVLEIGCGAGRVGDHLAPHVGTWIGADTSAQMLAHARTALTSHANVRLVQLNGYDLHGVDDGSVDAVYCTAVFMHLDEWDRYRYVEEAARVLRPGGGLYIDNFDLRSPDGWRLFTDMARLDPASRPANVSKASTAQELEWYAMQAGFIDVTVETGALFVTVTARRPA